MIVEKQMECTIIYFIYIDATGCLNIRKQDVDNVQKHNNFNTTAIPQYLHIALIAVSESFSFRFPVDSRKQIGKLRFYK
jgi:hypothetical protein